MNLLYVPATNEDIVPGATIKVTPHRKRSIIGVVQEAHSSRCERRFTLKTGMKDGEPVIEYFRRDDWSDMNVYVLVDQKKRIASMMRSLRARWSKPDPLTEPFTLVDGPFAGQKWRHQIRDGGTTLPFTCNGMTGHYRAYKWVPA